MTRTHGEYIDMVQRLNKPGTDILAGMMPQEAELLHMAFGLLLEIGELTEAAPTDRDNVIEELGDIEFFVTGVVMRFSNPALLDVGVSDVQADIYNGTLAHVGSIRLLLAISHLFDAACKLCNQVKRVVLYQKQNDQAVAYNLSRSCVAALAFCAEVFGTSREEIRAANYEKLAGKDGRYAQGRYTDAQAQERRDKAGGE